MKFEEVVLSLLPFTHLEEGTRSMSFGGWYTLSATEQISSFFVILLVTLYMFTFFNKINQKILYRPFINVFSRKTFLILGMFGMLLNLYMVYMLNTDLIEFKSFAIANSIEIFVWSIWIVIIDKITQSALNLKLKLSNSFEWNR